MAEAARYALGIRYSLLPYLYTSFRTTASHGCPLARPLMLGWPGDPAARTSDRQWTMGDAVLITPVLDQARSCLCHPCLWVHAHITPCIVPMHADLTRQCLCMDLFLTGINTRPHLVLQMQ